MGSYEEECHKQWEKLEEIAPYIGKIAIASVSLEETLTDVICRLINMHNDAPGLLITSRMNCSRKIELFNDLLTPLIECFERKDLTAKQKLIVSKLRELATKRNNAIHSAWHDIDVKTHKVRRRIKKDGVVFSDAEYRYEYIKITSKDLVRLEEDIWGLDEDLYEFMEDIDSL